MSSWETGDDDALLTLHDDVILAFPGKRLNKAGVVEASKVWRGEFRDTKVKVGRLVIEGNQFAVEYLYASTHIPTGKRQAVGTVAIGEVRDGKIYVWKEYLDGRVSRMQARGELPVDETAEPYPWPDTPESRVP
jgi:ketosteroid isomerase-like protein